MIEGTYIKNKDAQNPISRFHSLDPCNEKTWPGFGGHIVFLDNNIKLSFNSAWLLVGIWLFCIQHLPYWVRFWCMFGSSSVEVWTQNILYQFIESQFQFGMPSRGGKMSLAFNEPQTEIGCSTLTFKHNYLRAWTIITSGKKKLLILYFIGVHHSPHEKSHWVKG